ncbi:MAG: hypothetical protein SFZ23_02450 [Planctomycetota bacterium]|nr:hypothetical protein [Planctomycetota bacterium]
MIRQTLAIFLDAYRELNARKLFWITTGLSTLVVLVFAGLGINEKGINFLGFPLGFIELTSEDVAPALFYKVAFMNLGVNFWLTWIAMLLALLSTASIIPDFVAGGAIELTLCKPIGRARLFLTKYLSALLFAMMQVGAFTLVAFLVIGIRGKSWEPSIFLAVPVVVAVFSFTYCVQALVGLLTRSTIASLLVSLLFLGVVWLLHTADSTTTLFRESSRVRLEAASSTLAQMERNFRLRLELEQRAGQPGALPPERNPASLTPKELDERNPAIANQRRRVDDLQGTIKTLDKWNTGFLVAKTVLPKTSETSELLGRFLLTDEEFASISQRDQDSSGIQVDASDGESVQERQMVMNEAGARAQSVFRGRSIWWVLGTSLAFEAVVLGIATVIFVRRDF